MLVLVLAAATPLRAANEGQEDLDKATEAKLKLSPKSLADLNEVIRLTESALKKGLDDTQKQFAEKLLASTRMQRGTVIAEAVRKTLLPNWQDLRALALADLEYTVKFDPKQPQAWLSIAQLNFMPHGDAKQAKAALQKALDAAENDSGLRAKALELRAMVQTDPKKRLADLNEAVRLEPDDLDLLRSRGVFLIEQKKFKEALADFNKLLEKEPENAGAVLAKAIILAQTDQFDAALAALDQADQLVSKSPLLAKQKVQIHLLRAHIHSVQKKPDAALEDLNKAYDLDFGNVEILLLRSKIYVQKGDKAKAMEDADEAFRLRPYNPQVTFYKILLLTSQKKTDEALQLLDELQKRNPDNLEIACQKAALLMDAGKIDKALDLLEELQKHYPDNLLVLLQRGTILVQKKRSAEAVRLYSGYLKNHPDNPVILRARGDAYLNVGRHAEAVADYQKAYARNPEDYSLLNNFAWVLATSPDAKVRNGGQAVELAKKACKLTNYKLAYILSTLAAAYAETGDFKNARKWIDKAVELGDTEHDKELKEEQEKYRADKPVRELLTETESPAAEKPAEKKPAEEKPAAEKTPAAEKPAAPPETPDLKTVEPFNGKNLHGWTVKPPKDRNRWTVGVASVDPDDPTALKVSPADDKPGELINAKEGGEDIYTKKKFGDCTIDLELMIPKDSNSGVYVMGEYEIQVFDSAGKENIGPGDMGSIYSAAVSKVNAAKPAGQWQTMHIEFVAPRFTDGKKVANAKFLKVALNGKVIHENVEMQHQTPGGLTGREVPQGPLMFQGNHGPVAYRNIKITPTKK
jgi:tetratricopeptide (TPR) repeat protein